MAIAIVANRQAAHASPGSLDDTFGEGGIVTTLAGTEDNAFFALARQPDGKLLAAGYSRDLPTPPRMTVVRYLSDGSLDQTFGSNGVVAIDFNGQFSEGYALAVQPDGKIVVAGDAWSGTSRDMAVARLNADGTFDEAFGSGTGRSIIDLGSEDEAYAVVLQADGKLLLAGRGSSPAFPANEFTLVRCLSDGTLDPSFGNGLGYVFTDVLGGDDYAFSVAVQADQKIVVGGRSNGPGSQWAGSIVRYLLDGTLDQSFSDDGKFTALIGERTEVYSVVQQPDGKLLLAGYATEPTTDIVLIRLLGNGNLDPAFGNGTGIASHASSLNTIAYAAAIQPDGRIVVAGGALPHDVMVARFNSDGTLDQSFNCGAGVTRTSVFANDEARALILQPDGNVVVAGVARGTLPAYRMLLARYAGNFCEDPQNCPVCGNCILDAGEQCDDGNTGIGDCCSDSCSFESGQCDRGDPCTLGACGGGTCLPSDTPRFTACVETSTNRKSKLTIKRSADPARQTLTWTWSKGNSFTIDPADNPFLGSSYVTCVFDSSGAANATRLRVEASVPSGGVCASRSCWKQLGSRYRYVDRELTPDGIERVMMSPSGIVGRSSISVRGKGANLMLPTTPLVPPVVVQFGNSAGKCAQAEFHQGGDPSKLVWRFVSE